MLTNLTLECVYETFSCKFANNFDCNSFCICFGKEAKK